MRYTDKIVIWISPVLLLINIIILAFSTIVLTKDFSSFGFLKHSLSFFTVFLVPVLFILYLISVFNFMGNKKHSFKMMGYIALAVLVMNSVTFPFAYQYFYSNNIITMALCMPMFLILLYAYAVFCRVKKTSRT